MPSYKMGLPLYNPSQSTSILLSDPEPEPDSGWSLPPNRNPPITHHYSLVRLRPDIYQDLYTLYPRQPNPDTPSIERRRPSPTPKPPRRFPERWEYDAREGRDLVRSLEALPRRPSLERQEAFCSERGSRKRSRSDDSQDEDEKELYRLGLLYDDPHERGAAFTFHAIVRQEPLYTVNVRPRKRERKTARTGQQDDYRYALPLELSFAAMEDDESVARLLMAPDEDEIPTPMHDTTHRPSQGESGTRLTIIYELEREDMLLQDTQTTHSLHPPTADDFPDLISDSEQSDWEILNDDDNGTANPDAWVVLG